MISLELFCRSFETFRFFLIENSKLSVIKAIVETFNTINWISSGFKTLQKKLITNCYRQN